MEEPPDPPLAAPPAPCRTSAAGAPPAASWRMPRRQLVAAAAVLVLLLFLIRDCVQHSRWYAFTTDVSAKEKWRLLRFVDQPTGTTSSPSPLPLDFRIRGLSPPSQTSLEAAFLSGGGDANGGLSGDACSASCCFALLGEPRTAANSRRLQNERPACAEVESSSSITSTIPIAVTYILVLILVLFSGLFSGLTLGLMGLDKTGLEIVMEGDDPVNAAAARKIYPIRKNGNLLLCTLLLGNVAVNALLSILTADIWGGLVGFLSSTIVIVIFGEILPQAACSRYALQVGSRTIPIVKVIMCLLYPATFPLSFMLDKLLGHELGTTYSKAEMTKLLEIHVKEGRFNQETGTAMTGALKYQDVTVKEVMTPLDNTFMLSADEKLSFETIARIFKTGYSRIPVYEVSMNNVIGLLFTKDLIFVDPEDDTLVRSFVQIFGRGLHVVWPDDKLGDVLRALKQGHSHMALVRDVNQADGNQDPFYEIKGIITLEDIIEVILGDEIVDETDAFVDQQHSTKVDRDADFDWARLRLLDSKIVDETLSDEEVKAVTAHLRTNHEEAVALLSDKQLTRMVAETPVTELPEAELEVGEDLPENTLYRKDVPSDACTLILGGKVTVLAGVDNFKSDVSSWSVLASGALANPNYAPDFSAFVSEKCRCLILTRVRFTAALDASTVEKLSESHRGAFNAGASDKFEDEDMDGVSTDAKGTSTVGTNPSVLIDMNQNDVVIDMKEKEVVIDMNAIDKVQISSNGAEEAPTATVTTVAPKSAAVDPKTKNPSRRVVFSVETEKVASTLSLSNHQPNEPVDQKENIEKHLQKRTEQRKATRDRRSKLLAAFLHRKDGSHRSADGSSVGFEREESTGHSNRGELPNEGRPSRISPPDSPRTVSSSTHPERMASLRSRLTDGGCYALAPSTRSSQSQTPSGASQRPRSGSFQFIDSKRSENE